MLVLVKLLHTLVWWIMATATFLLFKAVTLQRFDTLLYTALGLLVLETLVLLFNRWVCPLTPFASKLTSDRSANFDIYLPSFIARYNKQIFSVLFLLIILIHIYKAYIIP